MTTRLLLAAALLLGATSAAHADGVANTLGRIFGDFGGGAGEAVTQGIRDSQARGVTIQPRPKADCLADSNRGINSTYVPCRHGRQEFTRFDSERSRVVLSERAIPEW